MYAAGSSSVSRRRARRGARRRRLHSPKAVLVLIGCPTRGGLRVRPRRSAARIEGIELSTMETRARSTGLDQVRSMNQARYSTASSGAPRETACAWCFARLEHEQGPSGCAGRAAVRWSGQRADRASNTRPPAVGLREQLLEQRGTTPDQARPGCRTLLRPAQICRHQRRSAR